MEQTRESVSAAASFASEPGRGASFHHLLVLPSPTDTADDAIVDKAGTSQRAVSLYPNLGRDELTLNRLRFPSDLFGRDCEIAELRTSWKNVVERRKIHVRRRDTVLEAKRRGSSIAAIANKKITMATAIAADAKPDTASTPSSASGFATPAKETKAASARNAVAETDAALLTTSSPKLVLISGESGVGKSALANNLREPVRISGGLYASGKFDFRKAPGRAGGGGGVEPYSAFSAAFAALCGDLLGQKRRKNGSKQIEGAHSPLSASFLRMRLAVKEAVGSEGVAALSEIVPNIRELVDAEPPNVNRHGSMGHATDSDANNYGAHVPSDDTDTGYEGTKSQFSYLLRQFLRAVCGQRPLILFLDDLQWADTSSLELLRTIVADIDNPGLLIIGTYRDDEVDDVHPLTDWMREVEGEERTERLESSRANGRGGSSTNDKNMTPVSRIVLTNLGLGAVNDLIAEVLSSTAKKTQSLAEIVHFKTHGNVFFVVQFLRLIKSEGALIYSIGTLSWTWDEEAIRAKMSATTNVVDMMLNTLRNKVDTDTRRVLRIAACLGSTFDVSTLSCVMEKIGDEESGGTSRNATALLPRNNTRPVNSSLNLVRMNCMKLLECLNACVDKQLLEREMSPTGTGKAVAGAGGAANIYRFCHDQIAAAAFKLLSEDQRDAVQRNIGRILLKSMTETQVERNIFLVVGLLNHGAERLIKVCEGANASNDDDRHASAESMTRAEEALELAELNLRAGRKAMTSAAFGPAATFLRTGLGLLGPDPWSEAGAVCLGLYTALAEAERNNAQPEEVRHCADEVLRRHDLDINEKIPAYITLTNQMLSSQDGRASDGVELLLHVLSELGVSLPKRGFKPATAAAFFKTKRALKRLEISSLPNLPAMNDRNKLLAMRIMEMISVQAPFSDPRILPLVNLKMVRWSIQHGVSRYSAGAFMFYGLILLVKFGHLRVGNEYGKVALILQERFGAKWTSQLQHFMYSMLLSHWVKPLYLSRKVFLKHYDISMQIGNVGMAMVHIRAYCVTSLFIGSPLAVLELQMKMYGRQMKELKQEKMLAWLLPTWQLVLNLMTGSQENPAVLAGEVFDQKKMLSQCHARNDENLTHIIIFHQVWAAFVFNDLELAGQLIEQTKTFERTNMGAPSIWRLALYEGLIAFGLVQNTGSRKWKSRAKRVLKKVRRWVEQGNVNCKHILLLLEAESAALCEKDTAKQKYNDAITTAARHGLVHDRALANERAGEYYLRRGDVYWSAHHLKLSYDLYSQWGATAKADHLLKTHKDVFGESVFTTTGTVAL